VEKIEGGKTFKTTPISCALSGNNVIVAAVSGKRIKVYVIVFISTGTVNAKWCSASTDLTGDKNFQAREGYTLAVNPPAILLQTVAGETLNLNLSAAVAVDGWIAYWDDDAT
jgi:hypothetical protein